MCMNQPSSDKNNHRPSRPWRHFFAWLLWVANVSTAVPPPANEPQFGGTQIEHASIPTNEIVPSSINNVADTVDTTQNNISTVLQTPEENPEQKIVNMLNWFRKNLHTGKGIASEKEQDEFFTLCHKHFLWDDMIVSGNFEANIKPIQRYLPRVGVSVADLTRLFWIR